MSTNTANVTVNFSTNASSVSTEIAKLRSETTDLASSLGNLENQSEQVDSSLRDVASSANRTDDALDSLGGTSVSTNLSVGKLVGGLLTLELAKKTVQAATRSLISAFNDYANRTDANTAKQAQLSEALETLKGAFSEAAFGGGNFDLVVNNMTATLENLTTIIGQTSGAINNMVEGFSRVASIGTTIVAAISQGENFVEAIEEQQSYQRFLRGESSENERQFWQNRIRTQEAALAQEQEIANRHTAIVESFNAAQSSAGALLRFGGGTAVEPSASQGGSSGSSATEAVEAQRVMLGRSLEEMYREVQDSESRRLQAAQDFRDREVAAAQERADALLAIEENLSLKRKQESEAFYQQQEEEAISRTEKLNSILGEGGSLIGDALSSSIGAAMDGKDFGKSVLKSFGDYLTKKGAAMITEGSVDTLVGAVSGNPQQVAAGAAKLGGGAALIAAGKGLGAAGKDGKKVSNSGTPSTPPAQAQPVQNTYNVSTNVGMAGDMRAFGREISYQNDKARRLGYT